MATVLLTGGRGLVGMYLCRRLQEKGFDVAILSRSKNANTEIPTYIWDLSKMEIEKRAIDTADYIIHLAGENIGNKRWTAKRKKQIIDSRTRSSELLFNKIKEQNKCIRAFISASAIGYYGSITTDKIFNETDPPANDFLGQTCSKWEQSTEKFKESGIRTVIIRTGIVLARNGGVLSMITAAVKTGFGSALGNGKQWIPWIHIEDLCGIYIKAIEDIEMTGAYNAVAPEQRTNSEFIRTTAQVLQKPFWFPDIPAVIMRLMFGKMSEMILKGSRVSSERIEKAGYSFMFPDLKNALYDLIRKE